MPRRKERPSSPTAGGSERVLLTVTQLARYLNVSRLYLYRVVKKLGEEEGVYQLPSQGGTQMIRIDRGKFLRRPSHEPPAVEVDRDNAAEHIKYLLAAVEPMRTRLSAIAKEFDAWVKEMERLYDE